MVEMDSCDNVEDASVQAGCKEGVFPIDADDADDDDDDDNDDADVPDITDVADDASGSSKDPMDLDLKWCCCCMGERDGERLVVRRGDGAKARGVGKGIEWPVDETDGTDVVVWSKSLPLLLLPAAANPTDEDKVDRPEYCAYLGDVSDPGDEPGDECNDESGDGDTTVDIMDMVGEELVLRLSNRRGMEGITDEEFVDVAVTVGVKVVLVSVDVEVN